MRSRTGAARAGGEGRGPLCFRERSALTAESTGARTGRPCFVARRLVALENTAFFLQIERLWQLYIKQVGRCHFSTDICSLHVCVSHFGNSHNILNFFSITCISKRWSVIFNVSIVIVWGRHQPHSRKTANLHVVCVLMLRQSVVPPSLSEIY